MIELSPDNGLSPQIHFGAPEYDGTDLKTFTNKAGAIVKHLTGLKNGEANSYFPTDIKVTPSLVEDDHFFVFGSHVETQAPRGMVGIMQVQENLFEVVIDEHDAWLHQRTENGFSYKLTTVEALILVGLTRQAAFRESQCRATGRQGSL